MSGVYIPDMTESEYEELCKWAKYGANNCMIGDKPCIPVPDHGRLIDADALQRVTIEQQNNDYNIKAVPRNWAYAFCAFEEIVFDAPTIIPADKEEET